MNSLKVENLSARIEDKQILKELNLEIPSGEVRHNKLNGVVKVPSQKCFSETPW